MQLQPVIHVAPDGNSAQARWRTFMQVGHLGKEARWGEATYENAYVKEDGVWKIRKLHGFITFYVEFDKGWNKAAVPLPQKLGDLDPDAPNRQWRISRVSYRIPLPQPGPGSNAVIARWRSRPDDAMVVVPRALHRRTVPRPAIAPVSTGHDGYSGRCRR